MNASTVACPSETELTLFIERSLVDHDEERVLSHLDQCDTCRSTISLLAPALPGPELPIESPIAEGTQLGRYRITRNLGHGSMGDVFEALDETLERRVAIKCLRRSALSHERDALLISEARTLARLRHPHIVTVYDAGSTESRAWLAMEFVPGQTLRAFLRTNPPRHTVLRLFREAAEGLAAAHAAQVVHRDVKPDNLLVDDAHHIRVGDFGLAALAGTQGQIAGTPAYMSPEQRAGRPVGPQSDQYSLAVCLVEALTGARTLEPLQLPLGVPARVSSALQRALQPNPELRFASMLEFAAQLEPRRWPAWSLGLFASAALALGLFAFTLKAPCTEGAALAEQSWPSQRDHRLDAAFGNHFEALQLFERSLDDWRKTWASAHRSVCLEAKAGLAPRAAQARFACLSAQRQRIDGLLRLLASQPNGKGWVQAPRALRFIEDEDCSNDSGEGSPLSLDAHTTETIEQASLLTQFGEARRAVELLDALADAGRGALPLPALVQQARAYIELEDPRALDALAAARRVAVGEHDDRVLAHLAMLEAKWAGIVKTDFARARSLLKEADEWLARAGWRVQEASHIIQMRASVETNAGDLEAALAASTESLRLLDTINADAVTRVGALSNHSLILYYRRQFDLSLPVAQQALELSQRTLGEENEATAHAHVTLGNVLASMNRGEEAISHHRLARDLRVALGADAVTVDESTLNLCNSLYQAGHSREAEVEARRALEHRGEMNPFGEYERIIGYALAAQGRFDEAIAEMQEGLRVVIAHYGEAHPTTGNATYEMGQVLLAAHRPQEALKTYTRALQLDTQTNQPLSVLASDQTGRARAMLALGHADDAIAELSPILPRLGSDDSTSAAEARLALGEAFAAQRRWADAREQLNAGAEGVLAWAMQVRAAWLRCQTEEALKEPTLAKAACNRAATLLAQRDTVCDERARVTAWLTKH